MNQTRRHLRVVSTGPVAQATSQEVGVRFSSTAALGARLQRPQNSFGWLGPGRLGISSRGIQVTARSATLLGLRPTQRFIPAAQIHNVYREANAIQVHLRGRGPRHPYFRFWAEDAAAAARIVALLPTPDTIEFEIALEEPPTRTPWRRPLVWLLALLVALVLVGSLAWLSGFLKMQRRSAPIVAPRPAPAVLRPPPRVAPEDALRARIDLTKYDERLQALRVEFDLAFEALLEGRVTQAAFIEQLQQWQLPQWDLLELQIRRTRAPPGSVQESADEHLLGTINNWQLALRSYADDLHNGRRVVDAFAYLRRADVQRAAAARILEGLEGPAANSP